jgi:hypothetical protein
LLNPLFILPNSFCLAFFFVCYSGHIIYAFTFLYYIVLAVPVMPVRNKLWGLRIPKRRSEETLESPSERQKVLLLQKGMKSTRSVLSKHTEWDIHSSFISNAALPLTRIGPHLGSQFFAIGYCLG